MQSFKTAALLIAVLLTACASGSDVSKLLEKQSPSSRGVTAAAGVRGDDTKTEGAATAEANAHCDRLGKKLSVQNVETKSTDSGSTTEIDFQCLGPSDPDNSVKRAYRIVIKQRGN